MLHNLISADREGKCDGHLQAIQDRLPFFCEADCINYLQYITWYLEKFQRLDQEHPYIYTKFLAGKSVLQTSVCTFKELSPDMKLGQTIYHSKKKVLMES